MADLLAILLSDGADGIFDDLGIDRLPFDIPSGEHRRLGGDMAESCAVLLSDGDQRGAIDLADTGHGGGG
jgi:hypothetical protein